MGNPFLAAIDVIREKGWCQFEFTGVDGSRCIVGAVNDAVPRLDGESGVDHLRRSELVHNHLTRTLREFDPDSGPYGPMIWNDLRERTEEDVVLLLKHAAVSWEGE